MVDDADLGPVLARQELDLVTIDRLVQRLGQAAYELEFPNGGVAYVVGNIIGQSRGTQNPTMLAFGAEGSDDRVHALHVVNNTFINHALRPAVFVRVFESKLRSAVEQRLANNLFLGLGVADASLADWARGNFIASPSVLHDADLGLFALHRSSWLRGRGAPPGSARGVDLSPAFEFTPPVGKRAIAPPAAWSPGAYQE